MSADKPLQPTEVWMPSQGGRPMPIGEPEVVWVCIFCGREDCPAADVAGTLFVKKPQEPSYQYPPPILQPCRGFYEREARDCRHARKRYTVNNGWSCLDCGSAVPLTGE